MRYVGCKRRLLPFIHDTMEQQRIKGESFCDLFAGTATVGQYFKQLGFKIISNDLLYCSYVQQKVKLSINKMPCFKKVVQALGLKAKDNISNAQSVISYLNQLIGKAGFIYQHYSLGGTQQSDMPRLYYTDENAKKIDAIRETIALWQASQLIDEEEYYLLLYALLDEASNRANTTGTTSSFLKAFQRKALLPIQLKVPVVTQSALQHPVYCADSIELIRDLETVDILYLDPPYTPAQYANAYHLLETIARWDCPTLQGISGKRDTAPLRSPLSSRREALHALEQIIASGRYRHLLLSYSSDGLISHDALLALLERYGKVHVRRQAVRRYNTMSPSDARYNPCRHSEERLYYLKPAVANVTAFSIQRAANSTVSTTTRTIFV